jgi:tetratricopeptide (TPR) repeat protein
MHPFRRFARAAALVFVFVALPAAADDAVRPATVSAAQEAADLKVVEAAMGAFNDGGFRALAEHLPALKDVVAHAPASYPKVDRRGDPIVVHTSDERESLMFMLGAAGDSARGTGDGRSTTVSPNTYPTACLILAAYAVENRQYEEALKWLDIGLAIQPGNPDLALEKATALLQLHRAAEGAELLKDVIAHLEDWPLADKSRLYRNLGIAYADIDKFDEAEAALRESIRLEPNNPRARAELEYVARRRAGAPPTQASVVLANPPPAEQPGETGKQD